MWRMLGELSVVAAMVVGFWFPNLDLKTVPSPSCPLTGDVVVPLSEDLLLANRGEAASFFGPVDVDIPAGTYDIILASYDAHFIKVDQVQPHEQWALQGLDAGIVVFTSEATPDLPSDQETITAVVASGVALPELSALIARHAFYPDPEDNPNSIAPLCAAFRRVVPEEGRIVVSKIVETGSSDHVFSFEGALKADLMDGESAVQVVSPGSHQVKELVRPDWVLDSIDCDNSESRVDVGTATATFVVHPGETVTCAFTNRSVVGLLGEIGDLVWEDLDGDGIQDEDEPGVPAVEVELRDSGSKAVVEATRTDGSGRYLFGHVPEGGYLVVFIPPSGFGFSPADQGADDRIDSDVVAASSGTAPFFLGPGVTDLTRDAGLIRQAVSPSSSTSTTSIPPGSTTSTSVSSVSSTSTTSPDSLPFTGPSITPAGGIWAAFLVAIGFLALLATGADPVYVARGRLAAPSSIRPSRCDRCGLTLVAWEGLAPGAEPWGLELLACPRCTRFHQMPVMLPPDPWGPVA